MNDLVQTIQRLEAQLPSMSREQLTYLLMVVRAALAAMAKTQGAGLPHSAVADLEKAVPTALVQAIVQDNRRTSLPGWLPPSKSGVERGSGWAATPKPEDRSRQFAMFDQMVDAMVGGPNDTSKLK
jgi:hypothetical protein